jgi:hypothetical protein
MLHTLRFRSCDDARILLEESTIAYGLASRYERCAAQLGVPVHSQVRVELLDHNGELIDSRTFGVAETCGRIPSTVPGPPPPASPLPDASPSGSLLPESRQCSMPTSDGADWQDHPIHWLDLSLRRPAASRSANVADRIRCTHRWP